MEEVYTKVPYRDERGADGRRRLSDPVWEPIRFLTEVGIVDELSGAQKAFLEDVLLPTADGLPSSVDVAVLGGGLSALRVAVGLASSGATAAAVVVANFSDTSSGEGF